LTRSNIQGIECTNIVDIQKTINQAGKKERKNKNKGLYMMTSSINLKNLMQLQKRKKK